MTEEQIKKVFNLLQEQFNEDNLFYFKIISLKNIKAYFKETDEEFATFYLERIIEYLDNEERDY